ncbi:hypothetical protein DE158_001412 [Clostridium beijerinckii]|nr:hypothetical protein [Clostridium beijerinckii]
MGIKAFLENVETMEVRVYGKISGRKNEIW